jgi:hypothetical protein
MRIQIQRHAADGFTLYALDDQGHLMQERFIGYTVREARAIFRARYSIK